jgi:AraC family transcriptional activator of pobA
MAIVDVSLREPKGRDIVGSVTRYVEQNYAAPISLRDVAKALGYSPAHLTYSFRRRTGTPVTAWIIRRRISAAQELFSETGARVATACYAVGFNDTCYFTRQFIRHVGMTPGHYRTVVRDSRPRLTAAP